MTPLQKKSYELIVRVSSLEIQDHGDWRIKKLKEQLFSDMMEFGSFMESAFSSSDKFGFQFEMHQAHDFLRHVKLWLRLLDDLGYIEPEAMMPMAELSEEVHRLVLAAIRKVNAGSKQSFDPDSNLHTN